MISLRQHAVSLIAVFLALTLGLFLGSGFIGDRVNALTGTDRDRIGKLQDERDALDKEVGNDTAFIKAIGPELTKGILNKRGVLIVTAPDAADGDVEALKGLVNGAGGTVTGQIALTTALVRDEQASKLRTVVDQSIPAGAQLRVEYTDSGSRLGDLLGTALLTRPGQAPASDSDRSTALQTLRQAGFLEYPDGAVRPADLVLVVTGGEMSSDSGAQGQFVGRFSAAMAARGSGGVLAGRSGSAEGGSPIGVVRSDPSLNNAVSTVDNVDQQTGQLTTVLALGDETDGRTGAYGTGPGATAITVGAAPSK
ncbi:channel protein [Gordonia sihwensis]|uniref:copper transporter n=1 Tax=Gordonia sihwensis TaxID=173559 RepID=UPI001C9317AF|nr:copper transporter [Gordonia sihwensis]MBY4571827.1 channel protein [Gordonia sihwensis]